MSKDENKRRFRKEKAVIKKAGQHKMRRALKSSLKHNPDEAGFEDYEFDNGTRSKLWNGVYKDSKRYKEDARAGDALPLPPAD